MKNISIVKKINLILILICITSMFFSVSVQATIGNTFSDADIFLSKRRSSI